MLEEVTMTPERFQSTYQSVVDDVELMRLALGVVMYFSGDIGAQRAGLTAAIDAAWPLVAGGVRSFQTTNMKRPKTTKDGKQVLLQMLEDRPSETYNWVTVDNRRQLDEAPDCCVTISDASYRSGGYFLCRVPLGEPDAHRKLLDAVLQVASEWDFAHGYAGYTLAVNLLSLKAGAAERMFYGIGMRHPGIDLPSADNTSFVIGDGIKRVNWLTLLGSALTRRVGTLRALAREPEIVVHHPGPVTVIQAGDAPLMGDTNRRDTCEVYRRVGRALKDIRATTHPAFIIGPGEFMASEEKTRTWLSSLDE